MVLPSLLEEVVGCCDYIAQEYLMEVIIQVFQDEYHLHTLDSFLAIISQLESAVNVKQIVISIVDRFAKYAVRLKDDSEKSTPCNMFLTDIRGGIWNSRKYKFI
jgi:vacuolar protein sorting-associated protein 35